MRRPPFAALLLTLLLPLPVLAGQVTVKPGETLSQIAERHGVSLSTLMKLNGISKADHVEVGQVLKLPGGSGSGSRGAATGTVRVQEGDTLSEIADRQGMSLSQLMALNGISKADHVEVGQVLKVRGTAAAAAPAYRRGTSSHVVKPGESLSEIAEGYGVPMSRLVAINQLQDPDHVEVGSRLKLQGPVPSARPATTAAAPARPAPRPKAEPAAEQAVSRATQQAAPATAQPISDRLASRGSSPAAIATGPAATPSVVSTVATAPTQAAPRPISAATASETPRAIATTASTTYSPSSARTSSTGSTLASARSSTPATSPVPAAGTASATAAGDWRRYGPLQVDWSGWQPMGGSLVAPVMNAKGDTLYLAINCGARKLNATSAAGDWRTWDNPQADFEMKLVNDLCRSRSS